VGQEMQRKRGSSGGFEGEGDGLGAVVVGTQRVRGERTFMPVWTCSGSGSTLIRLPRTLVPSQSITPPRTAPRRRGGEGHDGERAQHAVRWDRHRLELGVPKHAAHALRRSKNRAPQFVHSLATGAGRGGGVGHSRERIQRSRVLTTRGSGVRVRRGVRTETSGDGRHRGASALSHSGRRVGRPDVVTQPCTVTPVARGRATPASSSTVIR
jgi:hypothetical protein